MEPVSFNRTSLHENNKGAGRASQTSQMITLNIGYTDSSMWNNTLNTLGGANARFRAVVLNNITAQSTLIQSELALNNNRRPVSENTCR